MKRSIPQVQQSFRNIADSLSNHGFVKYAKRLRRYTTELNRKKAVRKAPAKRRPITPALVLAVRTYARAHPRASNHDIANHFAIPNNARVSEILRGKRGTPLYDRKGRRIAGVT